VYSPLLRLKVSLPKAIVVSYLYNFTLVALGYNLSGECVKGLGGSGHTLAFPIAKTQ
jgi:hypothetical protein